MESSSSNSEEMKLQQMQLDEKELNKKCLAGFQKLKTHLGFLRSSSNITNITNTRLFEIAFRATLETCLVNEGRALDDNLVIKETTDGYVTSSEQLDESSSSQQPHATFLKIDSGLAVSTFIPTDDLIACLHKIMAFLSTVTVQQVQGRHGQNVAGNENRSSNYKSSSSGNKNRSSDYESNSLGNNADAKKMLVDTTSSDIENDDTGISYDSDTISEVHPDMFEIMFAHEIQNHEQPKSSPETYVVNNEAQQENSLLTNKLERYKEKEKHFAKDMTIDSEYYKKIKLLNDEISNVKSQACEKDKTFAKENKKYD
nr:hypothetical protein [Tanacetum cinerariifolium]